METIRVVATKNELDGYKENNEEWKKIRELWEERGGTYCRKFRLLCEKAVDVVIPVLERFNKNVRVNNFDKIVGFEPYHANEIKDLYDDGSRDEHYGAPAQGQPDLPSVEKLLENICRLTYWVEDIQILQGERTNRSIDKKDGWWCEKAGEKWKEIVVRL